MDSFFFINRVHIWVDFVREKVLPGLKFEFPYQEKMDGISVMFL